MPPLGLARNEEAFSRAVKFITNKSGFRQAEAEDCSDLIDQGEAHRYMESNQQLGKSW